MHPQIVVKDRLMLDGKEQHWDSHLHEFAVFWILERAPAITGNEIYLHGHRNLSPEKALTDT